MVSATYLTLAEPKEILFALWLNKIITLTKCIKKNNICIIYHSS